MGIVGSIRQGRVRRVGIMGNSKSLPSVNVIVSNTRVVCSLVIVVCHVSNDRHSFNANDSLESQVGLIPNVPISNCQNFVKEHSRQSAGKVICRDLVRGINCVIHQVCRPLLKLVVVLLKVVGVLRFEGICQSHDNHVSTFLKRHCFIIAVRMTSCIGVVTSNVVHGITVGVQPRFLELIVGLQNQLEELWVGVEENGMSREHNIHSIHVAIGRDLLHEKVDIVLSTTQLSGRKGLTDG